MTRFELLSLAVALIAVIVAFIDLLLKLFASLIRFLDNRYRRK